MAGKKYLAPNGKMYTQTGLDRLNMKQVFDMLTALGVADKALYRDFKAEKRAVSRPRRRTRTRTRRRRAPSPRYRVVYGRAPSPVRRQYRVVPRRAPSPVRRQYRVVPRARSPSRVRASPRVARLISPRSRLRGTVMRRTLPRTMPSAVPGHPNRCIRMGLVDCGGGRCATSRANC